MGGDVALEAHIVDRRRTGISRRFPDRDHRAQVSRRPPSEPPGVAAGSSDEGRIIQPARVAAERRMGFKPKKSATAGQRLKRRLEHVGVYKLQHASRPSPFDTHMDCRMIERWVIAIVADFQHPALGDPFRCEENVAG